MNSNLNTKTLSVSIALSQLNSPDFDADDCTEWLCIPFIVRGMKNLK